MVREGQLIIHDIGTFDLVTVPYHTIPLPYHTKPYHAIAAAKLNDEFGMGTVGV